MLDTFENGENLKEIQIYNKNGVHEGKIVANIKILKQMTKNREEEAKGILIQDQKS